MKRFKERVLKMKRMKYLALALMMTLTMVLSVACSTTEEAEPETTTETASTETTETAEETTEEAATEEATEEAADESAVTAPDGWPSKNIDFLIPAPAGALIDVAMRALGDTLDFGEPVVVTNMGGAGQTIGLTEVFGRGDDEYLVTSAGFAGYIIQPNILELPYSIDDFRYIAINHPPEPQLIVASAESEYKSWDDIIAAVKAGTEVTYSAPNPNGLGRMALLEVMTQEEVEFKFVPFSGSAEGFAALLGDHIDFYIIDASAAVPRVLENQFTGLMVVGPDRLSTIPDVPSATDQGLTDMEKFVGYTAIAVNKEMPDEVVQWIKYNIDIAQQSDEYKDYLTNVVGTSEELGVYTEEEVTAMMYATNDAIVAIMEEYGLSK